MMPTREQEQAVIDSIRRYESASFERRGAFYYESPGGELRWDDLPENDKLTFLDTNVNWEGFTREQEFAVITRAVEGQYQDFLMDDIQEQARNPEIPVTPEFDRVLSEVEEGWWRESPRGWETAEGGARSAEEWERMATDKDQPKAALDAIRDDYELRVENYRPRDEGLERER